MENSDFVDSLKSTELGRRLIQEQEHERQESRRSIAADLDALAADRARELPSLEAAAETAKAAADAARAEFELTETAHRRAAALLNNARASYSARRDRLLNRLRVSAPPEIDRFVQRLRGEIEQMRLDGVKTAGAKTNKIDPNTGTLAKDLYSDMPAKARRLAAMRDACKRAESLGLEVLTADELQAHLDDIYAALPIVEAERIGGGQ